MAVLGLLVLLMGGYLVLGLKAREYTWRVRAGLVLLTFLLPTAFYLLW
jgi:hypothetical protein